MSKLFTLIAMVIFCTAANAQEDSTKKESSQIDTIRVGNMIIIKDKSKAGNDKSDTRVYMGQKKIVSNVSTNWAIFDFGIANYDDQTNYSSTGGYLFNRPGTTPLGKGDFDLRDGKSININIWFFMQRLNLIKHYVNLKYGLGLELNNYLYNSHISYLQSNPFVPGQEAYPVIFRDSILFSKNKLAADYITIPFMINFSSNPAYENRGLSLSVGISTGYLYNSRNKQISDERGKLKNEGDYDLERFKFAYIAELGMGPVRLYGSYSPYSMYEGGLNMRPYAVGIRFSNW